MRRLVSLEVFKATAVLIVLALQVRPAPTAMPQLRAQPRPRRRCPCAVPQACTVAGLQLDPNGALFGFEMLSGLFFELSGLGIARSACRALDAGQPKRVVCGRLLRRGVLLIMASLLLRVLTSLSINLVLCRLWRDSGEAGSWWPGVVLRPVLEDGGRLP